MTCPTCGRYASREACTVHRPGRPSVQRLVVRCLGTCHPVTVEAPLGEPLPEPPRATPRRRHPRPVRLCADCGASLEGRRHDARRCRPCAAQHDLQLARERTRRNRGTAPDAPVQRPTVCPDCGADISHRHGRSLRCIDCADEHSAQQARARARRSRERTEVPA